MAEALITLAFQAIIWVYSAAAFVVGVMILIDCIRWAMEWLSTWRGGSHLKGAHNPLQARATRAATTSVARYVIGDRIEPMPYDIEDRPDAAAVASQAERRDRMRGQR